MPIEQETQKCINDSSEHRGTHFDTRCRQASLFRFILRFPGRAEATLVIRFLCKFAPCKYRKPRDAADREGRHEKKHHEPVEKLGGLRAAQGMRDQVPK